MKRRFLLIGFVLLMLVVSALACSTSKTTTETITEADLNEELVGEGLTADFQPGVVVFTGTIQGFDVELRMTLEAKDGGLYAQITEATVGGEAVPAEMFEEVNADLASSIFDDEEYTIDSVTITDTEIVIEATKK